MPFIYFRLSKCKKLSAMTLTELLVVMAILGILLLLAFPVLKPLFSRTHALEAKTQLKHIAELQKIYQLEHARYADQFQVLGFEQAMLVNQENGTAHYRVEIVNSGPQTFLARATSITDFDGDGNFNVWEVDRHGVPREITPD